MTCKCHMGESTGSRYDFIFGRELITNLVSDNNISEHTVLDMFRKNL